MRSVVVLLVSCLLCIAAGCATTRYDDCCASFDADQLPVPSNALAANPVSAQQESDTPAASPPQPTLASAEDGAEPRSEVEPIPVEPPDLSLDEVLRSVYDSYPLLQVAVQQREIADGQWTEAQGEFDLKLKGGAETGPLGYYKTNRTKVGFEQALFGGGQAFAGYRVCRGDFQPWYGERQTNDGGEFMAGVLIPLLQNRRIDPRRAAIFRAALGRDAVEPDILLQLIDSVRAASYTYWGWVAAGQDVKIAQALADIADQRQAGLQKRVDQGDLPRIELTDNERLIVSRRASLIDAQRKFEQAAIKLSLFVRTPDGQPSLVKPDRLPGDFPVPKPYDGAQMATDIQAAISSRPEIQYLDFVRAQLEVDAEQARNLYLPEFDVGVLGSQDVGGASSAKSDKSPFELEASLLVSLPLQRRKALGKLQATEGKLAQVTIKTQFARDKITAEVQNAVAAMTAAYLRIDQARQSAALNLAMEQAERSRFNQGDSNLLIVNLREQATADANKTLVAVLLEYYQAEADYRAALAAIPIQE